MSHIVQIKTELRDPIAIRMACNRLKLPQPTSGTFQLFSSQVAGLGVELPGWRYPVVCQLTNGKVQFDNYGGRWGDQKQLDRLLQAYAVEKATVEARRKGHSVTEQPLADGSIKLTVQVGGGV
ncbi:MAG: DUF1257 domain-containing protein [Blastopirellula sp.]|nr:MAG: DUF1257 domain-containing protein [Blastopirellula sp.]